MVRNRKETTHTMGVTWTWIASLALEIDRLRFFILKRVILHKIAWRNINI